jgi:orotidine-5'-phosphate decarboxylase
MEIISALDASTLGENDQLVAALAGRCRWYKVGMRQFYRDGAQGLSAVQAAGAELFLDLKLHDIPHTVATAVESVAWAAPSLLTVHALGGPRMVEAAVRAAEASGNGTRILAVTVLTSTSQDEMAALGWPGSVADYVHHLAGLARDAGAHGVVCAAGEAGAMRRILGDERLIVTPGIRLPEDAAGDQQRIATPARAMRAGATHIVVGRPLLNAPDPGAKWDRLINDCHSADVESEE